MSDASDKIAKRVVFPDYANSVTDILRATHKGYDLVTTFYGQFKDMPRWALMKDGQFSPAGRVNQAAASIVATTYCEKPTKLPDGTLLYKRRPDVPAHRTNHS